MKEKRVREKEEIQKRGEFHDRWGKIGQVGQIWTSFISNLEISYFVDFLIRNKITLPCNFFLKNINFENPIFGGANMDIC